MPDVVTGLIRANVACRAGLKVAKGTDSQIAIDQTGAEKLLGNGDMLFCRPPGATNPDASRLLPVGRRDLTDG